MENIHKQIEGLITRRKSGKLIYPSDFRGLGTDTAIKKSLSRLATKGSIKRLSHGMYYIPKIDPALGPLRPGVDDVIEMLKEKEKIRIEPTGAEALHALGLTTQVPTRRVYLTDGSQRVLSLGKLKIKLKATTPKKLSRKGKISKLVIYALEELGTENIDEVTRRRIRTLLQQEDPRLLKHDLTLSPVKVNNYIVNLLKEEDHG